MPKTKKRKKILKPRTLKKIKKIIPKKAKAGQRKKIIKKTAKNIFGQPVFAIKLKSPIKQTEPKFENFAPLKAEPEIKAIEPQSAEPLIPSKPLIKAPAIAMQRTRISRHVLDLKKTKTLQSKVTKPQEHEEQIYQHLLAKFNQKRQGFFASFKKRPEQVKTAVVLTNKQPAVTKQKTAVILPAKNISQPQKIAAKFSFPKLPDTEIRLGRLVLPAAWIKASLAFFAICLLVILPFFGYSYYQKLQGKQVKVFEQASQALLHLAIFQKAASAQDLATAQNQLEQSADNFNQAKTELDNINLLIKGLINIVPNTNKQFSTANNLLSAGEKLSNSAAVLTETLEQIKVDKSLAGLNLTKNLTILRNHLNLILPDLKTANAELQQITIEELPVDYQANIIKLRETLPAIIKNLDNFLSASDLLLNVFGADNQKRYLVLFQNNNELRPTGGFIGSYALVDIDRGNVENINVPSGGPYELKSGLKATIESPLPLHLVNARWEFQDGNWFADLPLSAEKLSYLFEKSGGPTTDGIIFINATLMEKILAITGPIDLPNYQLTINKDNFIAIVQKEVELNYDKEANKPKQIIADLTPILINKLLSSDQEQALALIDLFLTSLNQKEIQFYFTDYNLESFITKNNWGGQLKDTESDYLNIVSTNIAGEKTDAKISQSAMLDVEVQPDGSIINTLTITKTHHGLAGEAFYGVPNLDYLRIYVPSDSELLKAEGFESLPSEFFYVADHQTFTKDPDISLTEVTRNIDPLSGTEIFSESGKTVFGNWLKVEPGETKTVTISYRLPFKLSLEATQDNNLNVWQAIKDSLGFSENFMPDTQTYSLTWQKQPGKRDFNIHVQLSLPKILSYKFIYPNYIQKDLQTFSYTTELDTDKLMAIIFKP